MIKNSVYGSATDLKGGYAFSITPGIYTLVVSSVGFEDKSLPIKLLGNGSLNVELFDKSIKLEEVIVSALKADRNVRNNQMSIVELDKKAIKQIPSMFGEKDVVKSLTTMPGVKSVGELAVWLRY